jgi:hypothetical protein
VRGSEKVSKVPKGDICVQLRLDGFFDLSALGCGAKEMWFGTRARSGRSRRRLQLPSRVKGNANNFDLEDRPPRGVTFIADKSNEECWVNIGGVR